MDDFLRPVQTTRLLSKSSTPAKIPVTQASTVASPRDVLTVLRESPDIDTVRKALKFLQRQSNDVFNLKQPGALAAQILHVLASKTVPDFWALLESDDSLKSTRTALVACFDSVSGLGALVARLKVLITAHKSLGKEDEGRGFSQAQSLISLLDELLRPESFVGDVWKTVAGAGKTQQPILWREFVSLVASGRIVSTVAEADAILQKSGQRTADTWLASGSAYAKWLAASLAAVADEASSDDAELWMALGQMFRKSLSLGYSGVIIEELLQALPLKADSLLPKFGKMIGSIPVYDQRSVLRLVLSALALHHLGIQPRETDVLKTTPWDVTGSAALLRGIISDDATLLDALVACLTQLVPPATTQSVGLQRAALTALRDDSDRMETVLEKSLERFGDQLFIKHTPIIEQEATAQILLLSAGYIHRRNPMFLFTLVKSSMHTHGVSNRLSAGSPRARWLGMIVAMKISEMVDKPDARLVFTDESLETPEAEWYQALAQVDDKPGSIDNIRKARVEPTVPKVTPKKRAPPVAPKQQSKQPKSSTQITGPRIIEIVDEDSDDDLVPYDKPDSDPEDSDDDPTMIQRNKPRALVYIRDLLAGLRDSESYDRHYLSLSTAAPLIRRKTGFGKEISDHAEELTSLLVGLHDVFDLPDFAKLRQAALVALVVALPDIVGPYLVRSFFGGDYSLQQRNAILAALGLGARELAGFTDKEEGAPAAPAFPSKRLPAHLEKLYSDSKPVDRVTAKLEKLMVEPLALNAADQMSGPNVLKVRTFSSRMEVEKKRKKPIPNALARVVARDFFFPLTGGWWANVQAHGTASMYFSPHLLPAYLRTLALLIHASGPSTVMLPEMTREMWELLLSVRGPAVSSGDVGVLEGLLFAFLTLLEVNEDKERLAREHARELLETQEWAKGVLEGRAGGDEEGERVRMLAAAVVVRCHEVVEKWQRIMLGDMVDM
ncbi:hypothetical protein EJ06DRAFT_428657 [Trichodelitschia bisporula]|uniref:Telomere length regulation protein conserved domain-containing protein n=1 Tax=Trichodelitschia bisporula TaxID=703511 RepID=A0A6G1HX33_9PEZI|nr:hypothetical protein EJ06DRAFT_428657 [Trichodelitschia bisporula]